MEVGKILPLNQPFRVRLVRVKDRSLIHFIMDLRILLATIRWGNQLTVEDVMLAKSMSLVELIQSSFLNAKTIRVRCNSIIKRR